MHQLDTHPHTPYSNRSEHFKIDLETTTLFIKKKTQSKLIPRRKTGGKFASCRCSVAFRDKWDEMETNWKRARGDLFGPRRFF